MCKISFCIQDPHISTTRNMSELEAWLVIAPKSAADLSIGQSVEIRSAAKLGRIIT